MYYWPWWQVTGYLDFYMDNMIASMNIYSIIISMLTEYPRYPRNISNVSKKWLPMWIKTKTDVSQIRYATGNCQKYWCAVGQRLFWYINSVWKTWKWLNNGNSQYTAMYKIWCMIGTWPKVTHTIINQPIFCFVMTSCKTSTWMDLSEWYPCTN